MVCSTCKSIPGGDSRSFFDNEAEKQRKRKFKIRVASRARERACGGEPSCD